MESGRRYIVRTDHEPLSEMTVTINGPLRLSDEDCYKRAREAIAYMACGFGFNNPTGAY